jgi:hypothetical protein
MITAILDHRTDLDLVGAKVYSDGKHGKDVGALVGRDPTGARHRRHRGGAGRRG